MHLKKRSLKCKNDQLVYMYDEFCFSSSETNSRNKTDRGFPAMVVSIHCTYLITYLNCSISLTLKNSVTIFSPTVDFTGCQVVLQDDDDLHNAISATSIVVVDNAVYIVYLSGYLKTFAICFQWILVIRVNKDELMLHILKIIQK